jgi:hypothetical protein
MPPTPGHVNESPLAQSNESVRSAMEQASNAVASASRAVADANLAVRDSMPMGSRWTESPYQSPPDFQI